MGTFISVVNEEWSPTKIYILSIYWLWSTLIIGDLLITPINLFQILWESTRSYPTQPSYFLKLFEGLV